jgi:5-methylcytosine-specific restriction endonuclease McrA
MYKNPEYSKANNAKWRKSHREEDLARKRKWYLKNRIYLLQQAHLWRINNRETSRESNRKWKKNNPEIVLREGREWRKNNPDKVKVNDHRRLALKAGNGGSFTAAEWNSLCKHYRQHCLCCNKKRKLTADHVVPLSKGGTSNIENIQPLCGPCNSRKGTKTIDYRKQNPESPAIEQGNSSIS